MAKITFALKIVDGIGPVLVALVILAITHSAWAASPPAGALKYGPELCQTVKAYGLKIACEKVQGQVEQETCISLSNPKCWSPMAELKTPREYGFGLGQLTIAYKADGSVRFSAFDDVRRAHAELAGWRFSDRYLPELQMRALALMDRDCWDAADGAATQEDREAMALACYNGGAGGLRSDRLVCRNTVGCDPARWWGHVELTSNKSRQKWQGYGKSAFEINREYPANIRIRAVKYQGVANGVD